MSKRSRRCWVVVVFVALVIGIALVTAPRSPEEIQSDLEALVLQISEIRERLSALENEILKDDDIDSLKLERENLGQERALSEVIGDLLDLEEEFLREKKPDLWTTAFEEPFSRDKMRAAMLLLKIEEEIALAKAEIAAGWQESSMIEQKLAIQQKKDLLESLENEPPVACFNHSPPDPTTADVVQLTDCSSDEDGTIVKWTWDLGDGTASSEQNPIHQYQTAGTYKVALTVTDDAGATATMTREIIVREAFGFIEVVPDDELAQALGAIPKSILIILDTSSSMRDEFEDSTKMEVARQILKDTLAIVPDTMKVGLRVFAGCGKSDLLVPVSPLNRSLLGARIDAVSPASTTPLAYALSLASQDFAGIPDPKLILLVSDGEETCGGDPVAAAKAVLEVIPEMIFHAVGYDLRYAQKARDQLIEIANATGGTYMDAETSEQLRKALRLAIPISYQVFDERGELVFTGVLGESTSALSPGSYRVVIGTDPSVVADDVFVKADQTTTITLHRSQLE